MTKRKSFKERVRSRMAKTNESYSTARMHLEAQRKKLKAKKAKAVVGREVQPQNRSGRVPSSSGDAQSINYADLERLTGYPGETIKLLVQKVDEAVQCVALEMLLTYHERPGLHSGSEARLVQEWIDHLVEGMLRLNEGKKKAWRLENGLLLRFGRNSSTKFDPRLNPTGEVCPMLAYDFSVETPNSGVTKVWFAKPKAGVSRALTSTRKGPGTNLARLEYEWVYGLPVVKATEIALRKQANG